MINPTKEQKDRYWGYVYDKNDKKVLKELYAFSPEQLRGEYITVRFEEGDAKLSSITGQPIIGLSSSLLRTSLFKYYDIYQIEHEFPEYLV